MSRIFNFSAGPAVLPMPVLEEARDNLLELPGVGMSILEISHRSKTFDQIIQRAEANMRELLGIPSDYHVLFLQGGATLQFSMIPMNFAGGKPMDYVHTGSWAKAAMTEAKKVGPVQVAATCEEGNFSTIPAQSDLKLDPNAAYFHYTNNETIGGVQWKYVPEVGNVPLVCDTSSDFLSRPMDVKRFNIIYAGAQKNVGPSGVTVVILKNDLLTRVPANLPTMLDFKIMVQEKSLKNTPPVFGIYIIDLVLTHLKKNGGLGAMQKANDAKAKLLYDAIDASGGYYRGHAKADVRSPMNVTWRMPSEELEAKFAKEATAAGMDGLKGHRSVGGLRASIYNAFPREGVVALVDFMKEFQKKNG